MDAAEEPHEMPAQGVIEWLGSPGVGAAPSDKYWWISLVERTIDRATAIEDLAPGERLDWFRAAVAALGKAQNVGAIGRDDVVIRRLNLYAVLMRVIPDDEREGVLSADDAASLFVRSLPVSWDEAREFTTRWQTEPRDTLFVERQADVRRLRLIKNWLTPLATFAEEIASPQLRAETERWLELLPDLP
jgi:hypothetical protein